MKKYITLIIFIVFILNGCEDFLDIRPEASIPTTGIDYSKAENIFLPVSATYAKLRLSGAHAFPYIGAFEIASDNADKGSTPEDNPPMKEIDDFDYESTNGLINELWVSYFEIISASNYAIHQMPLFVNAISDNADKIYAMQSQGEAKTIRAYAYFNLTRLFGRVPIIDTILTSQQLAAASQASTTQLYEFIEQDLKDAIEVLPLSYTSEWAGRISKYTAMGIKAKVHLYQSEWDSVATLTDRIIASGRFELLNNFREVFSLSGENSDESIFEIQSSTLGKTTGDAAFLEYAYVQGPRGNSPSNMQGWGFSTPSQNLIDFFNLRGDSVRSATTLLYRGTVTPEGDSIKTSSSNPVYNGKVYTPSANNRWNFNGYGFDYNIRILRYADILLMYAEAIVNGATVPLTSGLTADEAVNIVRRRAGLPEITGVTLQQIWDERRAELAMEQDRFFDLIRTGQAQTVLSGKGFTPGKHEVYPIPQTQKDLNPNLIQNNLYN